MNLCLKVDIMNLKVVLRWQRSATVAQEAKGSVEVGEVIGSSRVYIFMNECMAYVD